MIHTCDGYCAVYICVPHTSNLNMYPHCNMSSLIRLNSMFISTNHTDDHCGSFTAPVYLENSSTKANIFPSQWAEFIQKRIPKNIDMYLTLIRPTNMSISTNHTDGHCGSFATLILQPSQIMFPSFVLPRAPITVGFISFAVLTCIFNKSYRWSLHLPPSLFGEHFNQGKLLTGILFCPGISFPLPRWLVFSTVEFEPF